MARTIWGEARGEKLIGMEAVACVIMNRLAVSEQEGGYWWGNNIQEICTKNSQFSVWNAKDPNREKILNVTEDDPIFKLAVEIAEDAIDGLIPYDDTKGATHYLNPRGVHIMPKWARDEPLAIIGKHHFFRPPEVPDLKKN